MRKKVTDVEVNIYRQDISSGMNLVKRHFKLLN